MESKSATTFTEAYLAIPMPSIEPLDGNDRARTLLYDSLDDLTNSDNRFKVRFGNGISELNIKLLTKQDRKQYLPIRLKERDQIDYCEILHISAEIPIDFYSNIELIEGHDFGSVVSFLASVDFQKNITDLLVIANIARVGSVEVLDAVVIQGEKELSIQIPRFYNLSVQEAVNVASRMQWPKLRNFSCYVAWEWAFNRPEMMDGFDGSKLGRALCAYSRLFEFKTADEPMQLLWALVGLEALYVKGKAELLQQVKEKSQVLLGDQKNFKKSISRMYDFRSRFVHGDLDFPGISFAHDARIEFERYSDELLEAIAIAIAVLAGSLQEIILRDWDGLRFEYSVHNTQE